MNKEEVTQACPTCGNRVCARAQYSSMEGESKVEYRPACACRGRELIRGCVSPSQLQHYKEARTTVLHVYRIGALIDAEEVVIILPAEETPPIRQFFSDGSSLLMDEPDFAGVPFEEPSANS